MKTKSTILNSCIFKLIVHLLNSYFPKSSCLLHRNLCHVALLIKKYFALSRLLITDFLLFNVFFKIFILGSQILGSWLLSLQSWVQGPSSWVLGLVYWVLSPGVFGHGSWVLILDYVTFYGSCNFFATSHAIDGFFINKYLTRLVMLLMFILQTWKKLLKISTIKICLLIKLISKVPSS